MDENENPDVCNVETEEFNGKHEVIKGIGNIEDLPEAILELILSFLPMEDAIRTSILSKKWQYLWTSIPELVFKQEFFSSQELFVSSIERVLLLHHGSIQKFQLDCKVQHSASRINTWVSKVVQRNIQDCSIRLSDVPKGYMLPHCLFCCDTLTCLCLEMPCTLELPADIYLPSLKSLDLGNVTFSDANLIQQLFASPELVELYICGCRWGHLRTVIISAPKLKTLSIGNDCGIKDDCCQVMITGCNLRSFNIFGRILNDYLISNSSVDLADISVYGYGRGTMGRNAHCLCKILHSIHAVQQLSLCRNVIGLIKDDRFGFPLWRLTWPVFHNMKNLQLGFLDINMLGKILQHIPHLQSLCLAEGLAASEGNDNDYILDPVPPCLLSSLTKVKIYIGSYYTRDLFAVKNLLKYAVVVEQLEICYSRRINMREVEVHAKLLDYARGLKNCEISIYSN